MATRNGWSAVGFGLLAAALLALYALGDTIAAWGIAAGVASLLAILCVGETEAALGVLRWPRREPSIRR